MNASSRLALLALAAGLLACTPERPEQAVEPARPVRVETVAPAPFRARVRLLGVVAAGESIPVVARQGGVAMLPPGRSAPPRTGERVRAGDVLLLIADEDARHAEAATRLALDEATTAAQRMRRGHADGVVPQEKLEAAEARERQAQEEHASARAKAGALALAAARDGVLSVDTPTAPGAVVTAGAVVARVVTEGALRVEAAAAASDRTALAPGLVATLSSHGHVDGEGRVAEVAPIVDAAGTVRVVLDVVSWEDPPAPGEGADVLVALPERVDAITLPQSALVIGSGGAAAFVVERSGSFEGPTHRARRRPVRLGRRSEDRVEILGGIAEGERVIVSGADVIADGDGVTVEEAPATP